MNDPADSAALRRHIDLSTEEAGTAVGVAAAVWNGEWDPEDRGGRLTIPEMAGLRRGFVTGKLTIDPGPDGTMLEFRPDGGTMRLNYSALLILLLGAGGGIVAMLWPFYPELLGLAPMGLVLAIVAWLLVASRLKAKGPSEFFDFIESMAKDESGSEEELQ